MNVRDFTAITIIYCLFLDMTEYLNKSIDILDFSERTRRSLLRFGIKTTNDLWFNRNFFQKLCISSKIQWIWKKWYAEIQKMINIISDEFINSSFVENETPYYGYPHLHRNTYTRSLNGEKQIPVDHYDIYGSLGEYPDQSRADCTLGENQLMLLWEDWLPLCVDEW